MVGGEAPQGLATSPTSFPGGLRTTWALVPWKAKALTPVRGRSIPSPPPPLSPPCLDDPAPLKGRKAVTGRPEAWRGRCQPAAAPACWLFMAAAPWGLRDPRCEIGMDILKGAWGHMGVKGSVKQSSCMP